MSAREVCKNGHDLTNPESYYSGASGSKRCRVCKKNEYAIRSAAVWKLKQERGDTRCDNTKSVMFGAAHLRMLSIITERERCATWWERKALDDEFAALQKQVGAATA